MELNNQIHPNAIVQNCALENDIKIYNGASVKDSSIKSKVSVGNDSVITESNIGDGTAINRRNYILKSTVGKYSYTGIGSMILSSVVGNFCSISWNVSIGGADHEHTNTSTLPKWRFQLMDTGSFDNLGKFNDPPCIIGNDVLISTNAIILRNVTIGDGAVIGAGAVVTKDVAPYSIVAGVPAKKLKMRFDEKTVEILLDIKWWNWPIEIIRAHQELLFSAELDKAAIEKMQHIASTITH